MSTKDDPLEPLDVVWSTDCSICKGSIDIDRDDSNYINFGYQTFRHWGMLGNVCAECVIKVFRALDLVIGDLKAVLAEAEQVAPKQKDLAAEERS